MNNVHTQGISDLTSSEGKLWRFSWICRLIYPRGILPREQIALIVQKEIGLTHRAVVGRHLRIMTHLGILDCEDHEYAVSSEGKALLELIRNKASETDLTLPEKIYYLRVLFGRVQPQLHTILVTLKEHEGEPEVAIAAAYFSKILDSRLQLWNLDTLREGLRMYESKRLLPRSLENKFDCMEMWIRQLDLLKPGSLNLTSTGHGVSNAISSRKISLLDSIYGLANVFIAGNAYSLPRFSYLNATHKVIFHKLFEVAYDLFYRLELRMSDARALKCFVCIKLLVDHHLTMEETDFDGLINVLASEGMIKSPMVGRDGKLAYVSK